MPSHETIQDALANIFAGIQQLKQALPGKAFTIDGRLVGDIGEALVQRDYDVTLYEGVAKHYDGETSDGRKVQIKATFKDALTFRKVSDYYIGIKIFEDGTYEEIFNGPGHIIAAEFAHRNGFGERLLLFPNKRLKALNATVKPADRIQQRKS